MSDWSIVQPGDNLFLQQPFLTAIEKAPPHGMSFRYITVFQDNEPIGVIYLQAKKYSAYESLNYHRAEVGASVPQWKKWISRQITFKGSVCGNSLLTGDNGYHLKLDWPEADKLEFVSLILNQVRGRTFKRKDRPTFVLYKDYYSSRGEVIGSGKHMLQMFCVQPNMILKFRDSWQSFDDYLSAMQSKYRVRIRKALERAAPLELQEVKSSDEVTDWDLLHDLYEAVANNAGFNLFDLHTMYWSELKNELGDAFRLYTYSLDGKVVAFFSAIIKDEEVDAHFLGYDYDLLKAYDIYLNMLIKLVKLGFASDKKKVVFSRTAMEIKSSVGAAPVPMFCYFQHDRWWGRKVFMRVLNSLNPTEDWHQRHPFKAHKP